MPSRESRSILVFVSLVLGLLLVSGMLFSQARQGGQQPNPNGFRPG